MRLVSCLIAAVCVSMLAGCATIVHGSKQGVPITSEPSGATVTVNGIEQGRTPMVAQLARKSDHIVVVQFGNERREFAITHGTGSATAVSAGNIIFGGLIGLGVDAASGAMNELTPDRIHADFTGPAAASLPPPTVNGAPPSADHTIEAVTVLTVLDDDSIVIVRRDNGEMFSLNHEPGLRSLSQFKDRQILIYSTTEFASDGSKIVLPGHNESAAIRSSDIVLLD